LTASRDFSLASLYAALDAHRQSRGLSWTQAVAEINRTSVRVSIHPISRSTVTGMRSKTTVEADGVLQMLIWLNRTPESFVPGLDGNGGDTRWPAMLPHQILRFDTAKLHRAIDVIRGERDLTWSQVAEEIGVGRAHVTHLAKGGRTAFPHVMRMVTWLGRPASDFMRVSEW
jgi:hypothetical protein